jgi:hypothetical protein
MRSPIPSTSRDYTEVRQEAIVGEKIIYLNEQTKKESTLSTTRKRQTEGEDKGAGKRDGGRDHGRE